MDKSPGFAERLADEDPEILARMDALARRGGPRLTDAELREAIQYARRLAPLPEARLPRLSTPAVRAPRLVEPPNPERGAAKLPTLLTPERASGPRGVDAPLGGLRVEPRGNGFAVRVHARDVDRANALARRLADSPNPAEALARDADVDLCFRLTDGSLLVGLSGCDRMLKLPADFHKQGSGGPDGKPFNPAWLDSAAAARECAEGEWLAVRLPVDADRRATIDVHARGPPDEGKTFILRGGKGAEASSLRGVADPEGDGIFWVRWKDLPADLRDDPRRLSGWLNGGDAAALGQAVREGKGDFAGSACPARGPEDVIAALREGRHADAAALIAADPVNARLHLDRHRSAGLDRCDRLLRDRRPAEALQVLAELRQLHGEQSEFAARAGVAEILRDRPEEAVADLNAFRPTASTDVNRLFDEVNHRLGDPRLPDGQRQDLLRGVRLIDFRSARAAAGKLGPDGDVALFPAADGRVLLEYRLQVRDLKPQRDIKAFDQANRPLLLFGEGDVLPDWTEGGHRGTLKGAVEGKTADLFELQAGDATHRAVAGLRPDVLVVETESVVPGAEKGVTRYTPHPKLWPAPPISVQYVPFLWNQSDDDEKKERRQVFLLRLRQKGNSGP